MENNITGSSNPISSIYTVIESRGLKKMFIYLVHNNATHNNQNVEADRMYIGKWKNKQNVF